MKSELVMHWSKLWKQSDTYECWKKQKLKLEMKYLLAYINIEFIVIVFEGRCVRSCFAWNELLTATFKEKRFLKEIVFMHHYSQQQQKSLSPSCGISFWDHIYGLKILALLNCTYSLQSSYQIVFVQYCTQLCSILDYRRTYLSKYAKRRPVRTMRIAIVGDFGASFHVMIVPVMPSTALCFRPPSACSCLVGGQRCGRRSRWTTTTNCG